LLPILQNGSGVPAQRLFRNGLIPVLADQNPYAQS
jgi:hypothetical protein